MLHIIILYTHTHTIYCAQGLVTGKEFAKFESFWHTGNSNLEATLSSNPSYPESEQASPGFPSPCFENSF